VEFEPTISVFERAKPVHALVLAAILIDSTTKYAYKIHMPFKITFFWNVTPAKVLEEPAARYPKDMRLKFFRNIDGYPPNNMASYAQESNLNI
jgi:hypothetical protein